MKAILTLIIFSALLVGCASGVQTANVDAKLNVHVIQNATPQQCTATWKGNTAPRPEVSYSRIGEVTTLSPPGDRSCTGCAIDQGSGDCVCKKCYDFYSTF